MWPGWPGQDCWPRLQVVHLHKRRRSVRVRWRHSRGSAKCFKSAHGVAPGAKSWVVKAAADGVQEGIEGAVILDLLDRYSVDLLLGEKGELDSVDRGRDRLRNIHGGITITRGPSKRVEGGVGRLVNDTLETDRWDLEMLRDLWRDRMTLTARSLTCN